MNPYKMWEEQSPRQVYQLLQTFRDMNTDSEDSESEVEVAKKDYTVKSKNVKLAEWMKDKIPKGANVYHADDIGKVIQGGI